MKMKIYTPNQVSLATFISSPIAGGILMAHNARMIGQPAKARWFIVITILATAALLLLAIFLLPERKPGNYLVPMLLALAMKYWANHEQGDVLADGRFPGATRASWRATVGITLLVLIGFILLVVCYGLIASG